MIENENINKGFITRAKKVGIESLEDLILHIPKGYKDYGDIVHSISDWVNTDIAKVFKLRVLSPPKINYKKKYISFFLTDGRTNVNAVFFAISEPLKLVNKGDIVHIEGAIQTKGDFVSFKSPTFVDGFMLNKIIAEYKGFPGQISPYLISKNISILLRDNLDEFCHYLNERFSIYDEDLPNLGIDFSCLKELFTSIHLPVDRLTSEKALKAIRLINAKSALGHALSSSVDVSNDDSIINFGVNEIKSKLSKISFSLTPSQKRSVWEISQDLNSNKPMDRLLSGDVGCGKTLTYSIPAICAMEAGKVVFILTPNTLLATQIANEIKETFSTNNVFLVLGGDHPKPNNDDLKSCPIIVGTTAILHWLKDSNVNYKPDFLIVDEQQKLGNQQKNQIIMPHTNFLEATATAIPRSTALVLYGNKKVSYLLECPVKKNIKTVIVDKLRQKSAFNTLRKIVSSGKQVAVLYPVREKDYMFYEINSGQPEQVLEIVSNIDDNCVSKIHGKTLFKLQKAQKTKLQKLLELNSIEAEFVDVPEIEDQKDNKRNVESAYKMWDKIYPGRVVMIHGGLSTEDKSNALEKAKNGECDVIITSSVIEIGLTLPDLMGLYVKNADLYGCSTLHQFRGRLSRKGGRGLFMMGVDCTQSEMSEKSLKRLSILVHNNNGYEIALEDMRQRGFGDLERNGTLQSGSVDGLFTGIKVLPEDVEELIKVYRK